MAPVPPMVRHGGMFRGNITMKGYLGNPAATAEASAAAGYNSGDLA